MRPAVVDRLADGGVVAVIRAASPDAAHRVAAGALAGGIRAIEITCTTPDAVDVIAELARAHASDPAVLIGAGTVRTIAEADAVLAAGARFLVSPHTDAALLVRAREAHVAGIAGAITPTEVATAWAAGAQVVKLFPAHVVGVGFLRDIASVFPEIPLMPTGGLSSADAESWLRAGAVAVGVGSALGSDTVDAIAARARAWIASVRAARA
jgi:2-dehydro-3-deoxyphosphogluconate aldolase / (4S)-4-hydroxy-2-oxoglutarate aldolase